MSKIKYITLDPYYDIDQYNSFLTSARNNQILIDEYILLKPPFRRYLALQEKDYPKFLDYEIGSSNDEKYLVSVIKPLDYKELYNLQRRKGHDNLYSEYVIPTPLRNLDKVDYVCLFKAWDPSEVTSFSTLLSNDIEIYKYGRSNLNGYNIYICTNPYIKGVIPNSRILLEYSNKSLSKNKNKTTKVPKDLGYIELDLNNYVLIKDKLILKTLEPESFKNGKRNVLNRNNFII